MSGEKRFAAEGQPDAVAPDGDELFRVHPAKLPAESAAVGGQKIRQLCAVEGDIHGVGVLLLREMPEIYEQLVAQTFLAEQRGLQLQKSLSAERMRTRFSTTASL